MTTITWIGGNGDWSDGADWSNSLAPNDLVTGGTSDVIFDSATPTTLTIAAGESYSAHSVAVDTSGSTLVVTGTLALATGLAITAGAFELGGGLLEASGTQNAILDATGDSGPAISYDNVQLDNISVIGPISIPSQFDLSLGGNTTVYADASETTPGTITLGFGQLNLTAGNSGTVVANYSVGDTVGENGGALFNNPLNVAVGGTGGSIPTLVIGPDATFTNTIIESANTTIGSALINEGTLLNTPGNQLRLVVQDMAENFGTIEADQNWGGATIGDAIATWTNEATGLITSDYSTIALLNNFTNLGTIQATDADFSPGIVQVGGATSTWTNNGQIDAPGGTVVLEGDETAADLGTINASDGGRLVFSYGTLDNTGGTLGAATPSLHDIDLENGTIKGGQVDIEGLGITIDAGGISGILLGAGTLDGVAIIGADLSDDSVVFADGSAVYTDDSETSLATIDLGDYGNLTIVGDTLTQSVNLGSSFSSFTGDTGAVGTAFTILAGVTVQGAGLIFSTFASAVQLSRNDSPPGDLVNDGLIDATVVSFGLTIAADSLDNEGTIAVSAGTGMDVATDNFANFGLLVANNTGNITVNYGVPLAQGYVNETVIGAATNEAAGLIVAQSTGAVYLENDFVNAGTIIAADTVDGDDTPGLPGTIVLGSGPDSTWTSTGQITADGGIVVMEGDETAADLGSLAVSGGGIFVLSDGTLENTDGTLSAAQSWLQGLLVDGGAIKGGMLDATGLDITVGSQSDNFNPNSSFGTLDDVAVVGDLNYGTAVFEDGTAVYTDTTKAHLATIDLSGNILILGDTLTQSIDLENGSTIAGNTGTVSTAFTILAGVTIQAGAVGAVYALSDGVSYNSGPSTDMINDGEIAATTQSGAIYIMAASLTNNGTIDATTLARADINTASFTDSGLLAATSGGNIQINTVFTNFFDNILTGGSYLIGADSQLDFNQVGSLDFNQVGGLETDAASITLDGTNAILGVASQGTLIPLAASLTTIAAGGVFALGDGADFTTTNNLTNFGTIILTGDSTLTVGGFVNDGTLELDSGSRFVNTAVNNTGLGNGGELLLNGGTYTSLTNEAGGTVAGSGVIIGPVDNDGTITVTSGILRIEGAVTGSGGFVIDPGAELELDSSDAETVVFATGTDGSGGGVLHLAQPTLFTASLSDLTTGDDLDFSGAAIDSAAIITADSGAVLTFGLYNGGSDDIPLLDTAVTGNALPPLFDGRNGTQMTLLFIPAGTDTTPIPGADGGEDFAPAVQILYDVGSGPNTMPQTGLLTHQGVNWFLNLPGQELGTVSAPFFLSAVNLNQSSDTDEVDYRVIGGGENIVNLFGGESFIDGILPGGDINSSTGHVGLGPEIAIMPGQPVIYEITGNTYAGDLPTESLTINVPLISDSTFDTVGTTTGEGDGDVHLTTFDGLHYDFQEVGEFVLAKSTALGDDFQVQIRLAQYDANPVVSVTTALAVQLGADRVTFDATRDAMLWVDGAPVILQPGMSDTLADGSIQALTATSFLVTAATGEVVTVDADGGVLNYSVQIAGSYSDGGFIEGLLGNADGNPANDIALPAGTVLPQPLTQADLYDSFGNAWRVTDPGASTGIPSLLDYAADQDTATFTEPDFPQNTLSLADLPVSVLQSATEAVTTAGLDPTSVAGQDALLDYALTSDPSLIAGDASLPQPTGAPVTGLQIAPPSSAPAPTQSYGVAAPATMLTEPAGGSPDIPVVFTVYATQAVTADTVLDWSVLSAGAGFLTAADFGGTLPSGTATIADAATTSSFTIDLPAGVVSADIADTLRVQISDTDSAPLVAATADIVIGNATPVSGTPAQAQFIELGGPGTLVQNGDAATLDLGELLIDGVPPAISLAVANQAAPGANLLAGSFALSGDGAISLGGDGAFQGIAGGAFQAGITATLDTSVPGQHSETITLTPTDSNASGATDTLPAQTLTITADVTPACFAAGTRILTVRGPVAVEHLSEDDLIVTETGNVRPIKWIGHRRIACRGHAKPQDIWPVCVRADAFGTGRPHRDLWLSPDHAIFVASHGADVLIPVRYLINDRTIVQERVAEVTYYHVELPTHDVLLAENLACETYLDTGNRSAFSNGGAALMLHADFARGAWATQACATLVLEGPHLCAAKRRLLVQAAALGHRLADDSGLRVLVDGRAVTADIDGRTWRIRLPPAARGIRLVSDTWVPACMRPDEDDTRTLGVAIGNLRFDEELIDLDDPEIIVRLARGGAGLALDRGRCRAGAGRCAGTGVRRRDYRELLGETGPKDQSPPACTPSVCAIESPPTRQFA